MCTYTSVPLKSGRTYTFSPAIAELAHGMPPLEDVPLREKMTQRERVTVLARLLRIEETLHQLAADVDDLGLSATWLRLESVDDDIDDAIVKVTAAIGGGR